MFKLKALLIYSPLSITVAFTISRIPHFPTVINSNDIRKDANILFTHSSAVSPYSDAPIKKKDFSHGDDDFNHKTSLEELCSYLNVEPQNLLYLSDESGDGERGVFLNYGIKKGDILLKIPLSSCIRDDKPPLWYNTYKSKHKNDFDEGINKFHYNPSKWATRLAASLLDLKVCAAQNDEDEVSESSDDKVAFGLQKWLSMMPNEDFLRASLPVHWPEEIVPHAKCTALELSIDASYFARAEALSDLMEATKFESDDNKLNQFNIDEPNLGRISSNIFDIVQTRSCRVERMDGIQLRPSLRILAPIFDFINHGSHRHDGDGSANAYFGLEEEDDGDDLSLVVRARNNIGANEEVLIDYGDSARPAWRCLASYGFVPNYRLTSPDDELQDGEEDESVAEVFMDGGRYEVGSHTVPYEMAEAAYMSLLEAKQGPKAFNDDAIGADDDIKNLLTPEVALRIAKRVSDAAFQLLISPTADEDEKTKEDESILTAKQLAGSLRWSQHQVLINCAIGLRDYASR